jgi:hypothetical protein
LDRQNPSALAPATVAAVPANACVSALVWTEAEADHERRREQPAHGDGPDPKALAGERRDEQHPEAGEGQQPCAADREIAADPRAERGERQRDRHEEHDLTQQLGRRDRPRVGAVAVCGAVELAHRRQSTALARVRATRLAGCGGGARAANDPAARHEHPGARPLRLAG